YFTGIDDGIRRIGYHACRYCSDSVKTAFGMEEAYHNRGGTGQEKLQRSIKISNLAATVKRIAAILLLSLLVFNWVGYEFYTAILQERADKNMVANLDQTNYSDADLISIKVPATHLSS